MQRPNRKCSWEVESRGMKIIQIFQIEKSSRQKNVCKFVKGGVSKWTPSNFPVADARIASVFRYIKLYDLHLHLQNIYFGWVDCSFHNRHAFCTKMEKEMREIRMSLTGAAGGTRLR